MRIASLVPSATESLFALGLGDHVVAVTHECDWPPEVARLPKLTRSVIAPDLPTADIDGAVRALTGAGEPIYELDDEALRRLAPDVIVTQALCPVCAVSYDEVCSLAAELPGAPAVVSLDPQTLDEVLDDLPRLAEAGDARERGIALRDELRHRIRAVEAAAAGASRPTVLALEWLDPPYVAGHWVPEMVALAGGTNALGEAGAKSRVVDWEALEAAAADVVLVMPCGLYAGDAAAEARAHASEIRGVGAAKVFAVDAASSFSRPGPRLADGVELTGHLLHPKRVPPPSDLAWVELPELAGSRHVTHSSR